MNAVMKETLSELRRLTALLMYPEREEDSYACADWASVHSRLAACTDTLYPVRGADADEEASLCLALLMGYSASLTRDDAKVGRILRRSGAVLPLLSDPLRKCGLLTFCYAFSGDGRQLREALALAAGWKDTPRPDTDPLRLLSTLEILGGELD